MSPLDRKLARDLWRMKGQAAAIGAVTAETHSPIEGGVSPA